MMEMVTYLSFFGDLVTGYTLVGGSVKQSRKTWSLGNMLSDMPICREHAERMESERR